MTSYTAPAGVDAVGSYQIYFDLSLIPQEELKFLSLYQMLLTELDTGRYTVEQQKTLEQEYLTTVPLTNSIWILRPARQPPH